MDLISQHIMAMIAEIPWSVGADGAKISSPDLAELDECAAELRDDELLRVAAGNVKGSEMSQVKEMVIPPAKPQKVHFPT